MNGAYCIFPVESFRCRVLEIIQKSGKSLSELMAKYPKKVSTQEIKVDCPDSEKFKVINIVKIYLVNEVVFKKIIDIDGVRANITDTGWLLIRASNTSPYISIRAEGKDEEEKRRNREDVIAIVNGIESLVYRSQTAVKQTALKEAELLSEIATLRGYLYDRSAPVKIILEHLSLVMPASPKTTSRGGPKDLK